MNCPFHILIYQSRTRSYRELPLRLFEFGTRVPLREVGRRARPHARAGHDPGRRAHLLHQGADGRRARSRCSTSCSTCCATTASTTSTSSCRPSPRARRSAPTRSGTRPPRRCAPPREADGPRARARRGRRRVLRPEDLGAGARRDRPHVADVDDPARLPDCRSASTSHYVGADNERHRPIMIHRALFGSIERFFAVLVEHYAGAFPAWLAPVQVDGAAGRRPPRRRTRPHRRPA